MANIRAHVFVEGHVQGVYFRSETRAAAQRCGVTGWVKNLSDGRVEALFEGKDEDVQAMLEWCKKGPPYAIVNQVEANEEPFTGEFRDFQITY